MTLKRHTVTIRIYWAPKIIYVYILTTAHSNSGKKITTFYRCITKLESILINAHLIENGKYFTKKSQLFIFHVILLKGKANKKEQILRNIEYKNYFVLVSKEVFKHIIIVS